MPKGVAPPEVSTTFFSRSAIGWQSYLIEKYLKLSQISEPLDHTYKSLLNGVKLKILKFGQLKDRQNFVTQNERLIVVLFISVDSAV